MQYSSPIRWTYPKDHLLLWFNCHASVPVPYQDDPISKNVKVLTHGYPFKGEWVLNPMAIPVRPEIYEPYLQMQAQIQDCSSFAEHVDDELKGLLENHSGISKDEINKLDFMKRRNLLSSIIKSNPQIKAFPEFDTDTKRTAMTSLFFKYISDRNIYTHGILYYFMPQPKSQPPPSSKYIIKHVVAQGLDAYSEVTSEILGAYTIAGRKLSALITLVNQILFNVTGEELEKSRSRFERLTII